MVIAGILVIVVTVLGGYMMEGGKLKALINYAEFIILGGAVLGSLLVANPPEVLKHLMKETLGLLRPSHYTKEAYTRLLTMLYQLGVLTRREGLMTLERHINEPEKSPIFSGALSGADSEYALTFATDALRMITDGTDPLVLDDLMDADLEAWRSEKRHLVGVLQKVADALPGFGIVAAVLGVVITMASVGGEAEVVGELIAAALVGTFLGVLLAYGVFGPLAAALELRHKDEEQYLEALRSGILGIARGDQPLLLVDYARRSVEPSRRLGFVELEKSLKSGGAGGQSSDGGGAS